MSPALVDRILQAWERGAGLSLHRQVGLALAIAETAGQAGHRDYDHLALYERDAALLDLRTTLFGAWMDGVVRCPACAVEFDLPLDLTTLEQASPPAAAVRIEADGYAAFVRPPASGDLSALDDRLPDTAFAEALFKRCVDRPTQGDRPVAVEALPPSFRVAAAAELDARGFESPSVDLTCGECGHGWRAPIDIARTLIGELEGWVGRLLDDVHRIASAYHWSERDILAMPMRRRLFYLEAIG